MTNKLKVILSKKFRREAQKRFLDLLTNDWAEIFYCLTHRLPLASKFRDHQLQGDLKDYRECHIKPDLLLIYAIRDDELHLADLGSHSDLFG